MILETYTVSSVEKTQNDKKVVTYGGLAYSGCMVDYTMTNFIFFIFPSFPFFIFHHFNFFRLPSSFCPKSNASLPCTSLNPFLPFHSIATARLGTSWAGRGEDSTTVKTRSKVGMYMCSVTAYDLSHIGHGRVYINFDLLYGFLFLFLSHRKPQTSKIKKCFWLCPFFWLLGFEAIWSLPFFRF